MRTAVTGLAAAAAGLALARLAPLPVVLRALPADAHPGADPTVAVTHLVALAAWPLVGWLLAASAAAGAARLPGAAGRAADAVAGRITPALLRRTLGSTAALGLAMSPALTPGVALAATGRHLPGTCAPGSLPTLDRGPACTPAAPSPPPPSARADHLGPGPAVTAAPRTRTVVAGDTLWGIAAAELSAAGPPATAARVAARWPAWWQANRAVIGADPDLIHIGTVLVVPDSLEKTG